MSRQASVSAALATLALSLGALAPTSGTAQAAAACNAAPAPAEPTTGQVTENVNDVPLTMAETDGIRSAIEKNWLIPVGMANAENYTVSLRLHLTPDGVVTKIEVLDDTGDPGFRTIAESARRAILITQSELGRLPIPKDKYNPTLIVRWPMQLICEQRGGC